MSKTVDQRVVEMRFDNKQFEQNAKNSIQTLKNLKESLQFQGMTKSLNEIKDSVKKITDSVDFSKGVQAAGKLKNAISQVDMTPLANGIQQVQAHFSTLEIVGMTVLQNLVNTAVNAGKQIVNALAIEPITSGFEEYETQINAVQTILANTESKGSTLDDVNNALNELNKYADMTIYNFTEMTRNIGTFTAAGVDLDTSVAAIKGIANLAAVSGSTSQQASTAMYQLSQALAAGSVKLMDWNSVVNAGMGGQVFQDAIMETARVHGIAIDDMIKEEGSFRETLSDGWLSSDILIETLQKFTGDLSEADLKSKGYTDDQIANIMKMGTTANDAATKVKTFSQLVDTLKEAAQSGWTTSWEIIFGDFEQAKTLFTSISDSVSNVINNMSDSRNRFLKGVMYSNWDKIIYKLEKLDISSQTFTKQLESTITAHGLSVSDLTSQYGSLEIAFQKGAVSTDILREAVYSLNGVTETEDLNRMIEQVDHLGGRWKVIQTLTYVFRDLKSVLDPIKNALYDVFPELTTKMVKETITVVYNLAKSLQLNSEESDKLRRTFRGLFSVIDVVRKCVVALMTPLSSLGNFMGNTFLKYADKVLTVTANIGDALVAFDKKVKISELTVKFTKAFEDIGGTVGKFLDPLIKKCEHVMGGMGEFLVKINAGGKIINGMKSAMNGFCTIASTSVKLLVGFAESLSKDARVIEFVDKVKTKIQEAKDNVVSYGKTASSAVSNFFTKGSTRTYDNGIVVQSKSILDVLKELKNAADNDDISMDTFTNAFKDLRQIASIKWNNLKDSSETVQNLADTFSSLRKTVVDTANDIYNAVKGKIEAVLGGDISKESIINAFKQIPKLAPKATGVIKGFFSELQEQESVDNKIDFLTEKFVALKNVVTELGSKAFGALKNKLSEIWSDIPKDEIAAKIIETIKAIPSVLGDAFTSVKDFISDKLFGDKGGNGDKKVTDSVFSIGDAFTSVKEIISNAISGIIEAIKGVIDYIMGFSGDVSAVLFGVGAFKSGVGIGKAGKSASKLMNSFRAAFDKLADVDDIEANANIFEKVLDKLGETLSEFVDKIKVSSLLTIAASIAIVAAAIGGLSLIDDQKLTNATATVGGIFGAIIALIGSMKLLVKDGDQANNFVKTAVVILAIGTAVKSIAKALALLSGVENLDTSALALSGMLIALVAALKVIDTVDTISAGSAITMLAMVVSLRSLVKSIKKMNELMSPDEYKTTRASMIALGACLGAMTAALKVLGKNRTSVGTAATVLTMCLMLKTVISSISSMTELLTDEKGNLDGNKIKNTLAGLVGVFGSMMAVVIALKQLDGVKITLRTTLALKVLVGVIPTLTEAMTELSKIPSGWAVGRALVALGGALAEFIVALGVLNGISKGSGSIGQQIMLIGEMLSMAYVMKTLAAVMSELAELTWGEIGKSLTAMGGALVELVAAVSILAGEGFAGLVGAGTLALASEGIDTLAGAVSKFVAIVTDNDWEDVKKGLSAMNTALLEVAEGSIANSLGIIGSFTISNVAEPLGDLANSVKKWIGIEVPEGLGEDLASLGKGVEAFNLAGFGADAIAAVAEPLGDLAGSVKKWTNIVVPETLPSGLQSLAPGIKAFTTGGWGADAIATLAEPLGTLAGSVKAWSGIVIPPELGPSLKALAPGVGAFNLKGWGAEAIGQLVEPLKNLAGSVAAWSTVTIPENLVTNLAPLAEAMSAWMNVTFQSDLTDVGAALKNFAPGVSAFQSIYLPENIESGLKGLANGTNACNDIRTDNLIIVCNRLEDLSSSIITLNGIDVGPAVNSLMSFANAINNVQISTDKFQNLGTSITSIFAGAVLSDLGAVSNAGYALTERLSHGISTGLFLVKERAKNVVLDAVDSIDEVKSQFNYKGYQLIYEFSDTMQMYKYLASAAMTAVVARASAAAKEQYVYDAFHDAGKYLVQGFVNGISDNISSAAQAAASMASAASSAANAALDINSPSKVFYGIGGYAGQGFVNALQDYSGKSYSAGEGIATSAREGLQKAISNIANTMNNGVDDLTIRPVVDLSSVQSGVTAMNRLFNGTRSIGITGNLNAISAAVADRQNAASNDDVVMAVNALAGQLTGRSGDSYVINGITYDDGSNITSAVKSLVRAAKMERRV